MYKVGDKITIVGDAVYGGVGGDAGKKVPAWVKDKTHTILQVSATRKEYLLKEIYSWMPEKFVSLSIAVPAAKVVKTSSSAVKSTIVTTEVNVKSAVNNLYASFAVDQIPCYIYNLVTSTKTEFGLVPENVTDAMVANFEDQITKSRTSPFKAYSNSGPRDISFTITIHDDYCPLGILKTIRQLQALTLPEKTGGYINEPRCKVRIGKFINITAVCSSVSVEWATPYKDDVYSKADVSFSFNEIEDSSRYATEWEAMV